MSDIFESDIDDQTENLSELEDDVGISDSGDNLTIDTPLYNLKLDYSCETVYAKVQDKLNLKAGDFAIIPTRY